MSRSKLINVLVVVIFVCGLAVAAESPHTSFERRISVAKASSAAEKTILATVYTVYQFRAKDYICYWRARSIKGDFVKKFKPYFSEEIIEKFFQGSHNCHSVASGRYGFLPLDDPREWNDQQYVLVQIDKPEIAGESATVEVRFWRSLEKNKPPRTLDHGGTIVYLKRENDKWKIANFEGTDMLGANGFHSLLKDYPSIAKPDWKDMDYSKSLKNPQPFN